MVNSSGTKPPRWFWRTMAFWFCPSIWTSRKSSTKPPGGLVDDFRLVQIDGQNQKAIVRQNQRGGLVPLELTIRNATFVRQLADGLLNDRRPGGVQTPHHAGRGGHG